MLDGDWSSDVCSSDLLLFSNVVVKEQARVEDSVVLPNVNIGEGARITRAIIDKNCNIPPGMVIGENPEEDRKRFEVSPGGITLVTPEMLGSAFHYVR
jgi:glucose-1-phosphate adenylyltransferase